MHTGCLSACLPPFLTGHPQLLDEEADPGRCLITEYDGPLTLSFKAKLPGRCTDHASYCRPQGPPPPPDSLRRRLWEQQQQQGRLCDVQLRAADGELRWGHRAVLCAASSALENLIEAGVDTLLGLQVSVPPALLWRSSLWGERGGRGGAA